MGFKPHSPPFVPCETRAGPTSPTGQCPKRSSQPGPSSSSPQPADPPWKFGNPCTKPTTWRSYLPAQSMTTVVHASAG
uniref:Uncharacterized protein n=1 Tax=Arundo donax TaxID=35708 RepID=A0A0A8YWA8_ARUDO